MALKHVKRHPDTIQPSDAAPGLLVMVVSVPPRSPGPCSASARLTPSLALMSATLRLVVMAVVTPARALEQRPLGEGVSR